VGAAPSLALLLILLTPAAACAGGLPWWGAPDDPLAALDRTPVRDRRGRLQCPAVELVRYRGDLVRLDHPARVNAPFRERLQRFEALVRDVAIEVYGRAPQRIVHAGTFACRTVRHRERLSEHALGNAIDVVGFDFATAPSAERKGLGRLGRAFQVRVGRHWAPTDRTLRDPLAPRHAAFLRRLVERLDDRPDIFRGVIGPPARGHLDHLHLDGGRWHFRRYRAPADVSPPA
jgi:hypothetical protein